MRELFILAAATTLVACSDGAQKHVDQARDKAQEAISAVSAAAGAQTDAYRRQLENRLQLLTTKIEALRREMGKLEGDAQKTARAQLDALEKRRDELAKQLDGLKDKGGDAWGAARDGLDKAFGDLESAYEDVKDKLK
jgi:chromosome segregation ATPase